MAARRISPTVGRRRLGFELRRLREEAKVTIETVAEHLGCSSSKVSRIETGHIGVAPRDVREMLTLYQVTEEKIEELIQVARDAREKGWWQMFGTVLTGAYVGLEAAAARIRGYEAQLIPGLLQIEDYARSVMRAARPDITNELLDRRIQVRNIRQSLLTQDDPVDFWVVIDEAAFRRVVGSPAIMVKQLDWLLTKAADDHITIQVLPFSVGAHAAMDGTFAILEYDDPLDPDVVFAENAAGGLFLEKDYELARYKEIFQRVRETALPPDRSADLIAAQMKEFL